MWEVDVTRVEAWLLALEPADYELVVAALQLVRDVGPNLGRPLVDRVVTSRFSNMKELRPGSRGRSEIRILFAFDPRRRAILLIAGDKAGSWDRWYRQNVSTADEVFEQHLTDSKKENNQ